MKLLIKFIDFLKVKGEQEIWTLFLMQERLIYTASFLLEKGCDMPSLNFDFKNEVILFVQKINLKVMEAGTSVKFDGKLPSHFRRATLELPPRYTQTSTTPHLSFHHATLVPSR